MGIGVPVGVCVGVAADGVPVFVDVCVADVVVTASATFASAAASTARRMAGMATVKCSSSRRCDACTWEEMGRVGTTRRVSNGCLPCDFPQ